MPDDDAPNLHLGPIAVLLGAVLLLLVAFSGVPTAVESASVAGSSSNQSVACAGAPANAPSGSSAVGYTAEQTTNARIIASVGSEVGVSSRGQLIALMTALQESGLVNLTGGDRDSAGLFQQRPSQGWGTYAQVTDPVYASKKFYTRLVEVPGWSSLDPGAAAQAVQRSAYPSAYAGREGAASALLAAVAGQPVSGIVQAVACTGGANPADSSLGGRAVEAALSQLGVPYAWGGGSLTGPTHGVSYGASTVGFDCSGLVRYAWHRGDPRVTLPHSSAEISSGTRPVDRSKIAAGDILSFSLDGAGVSHDGIYDGHGGMIHAPKTGDVVRVVPNILLNPYFMAHLVSITRPTGVHSG